jgi:hypothetical protein
VLTVIKSSLPGDKACARSLETGFEIAKELGTLTLTLAKAWHVGVSAVMVDNIL